jgi:NAD(P)-dependent dehydrogenase (short-subunit alcohol dehydrogenase family)
MDGERTVTDFEGLVAVVTCGASGIGLATAELLASGGASVAVLDVKSDDLPGKMTGFRADVSSNDELTAALDAVVERFPRLDIVVINAGIGAQGDVSANDNDA